MVAHVEKWDTQRHIDRSVWSEAGKLGLLLCSVPEGSKTFITNGSSADMMLLAVKTDPKAGARGISLLIVDLRDTPGFQVTRVLDEVGQHGADTSELAFTDVRVPVSNLLGTAEGQGFGPSGR